jgi:DNA polymerase theta
MQNTDADIFRVIAARWNKIPETEVTETIRNQTKQICYGIIYGMGMKSLADALKTDEQAAQALTERFHSTYPAIRQYTEMIIKHAREKGYVETMTARRRYLSQIRSENSSDKAQAERQAVNTTIQGSAADIAKYAILRVERNLKKYQSELKINIPNVPASSVDFVLQLHDELIYELPVEKARQVAKILKHSMENCAQLSIPLRVKIKMGPSWGELSEMTL